MSIVSIRGLLVVVLLTAMLAIAAYGGGKAAQPTIAVMISAILMVVKYTPKFGQW